MSYYGAVQTFRNLLFQHCVSGCCGLTQKWYANNVHADTCACIDRQEANAHNRKSVKEWEGAGWVAGAVVVADMASVHLSISKHSQLSPLSTGGEVIPFFFSPPASPSSFPLSFLPSRLSRLIYLVPTSPFILHSLIFQYFFPPQKSLVCYFHFRSTLLLTIPSLLFYSQWNSPFSSKTKLPPASHVG